ncbi:ubiquinone/menaquinone biosynthesis methyltransferase [Rhizocola hellebori]|uniref:Ubiquinone/menaquinone biosynthesis methyltransferase n=1 Tax=Rhizocola hellebori TaxID=1392758 RepID=A0A8J3VGX3_9ACTN|nr:methyltransferase domain-containing protein [Rhizocola hellebori]GIH05637.1 ubiquinone/menaquinone biosynthesis methyltransferase [Rhizocola hellebori]
MSTYELSTRAAEFYESTFVPALFRRWAEHLVAQADPAQGDNVLDVACGTGIVARTAAAGGASATGVDLNPAMLSVAKRLAPSLNWVQGDAAALPFAEDSFDLVLSQAAMMFFPDRVGALAQMRRVAKPGARVLIQVPGRLTHSPGYAALADVVSRHAGPEAVELIASYFAAGDPDQLTAQAEQAGLTVTGAGNWMSATRLPGLQSFLDVELLPIAERVDDDVRARIVEDCRISLAPFISGEGIAAPIEVLLLTARA